LRDAIEDCALSARPLTVNKTYYTEYLKPKGYKFVYKDDNTFWVPIRGMDDKEGKIVVTGEVRI